MMDMSIIAYHGRFMYVVLLWPLQLKSKSVFMPLCPSLIIGQILNYKSKNLKQKIDIHIAGWIATAMMPY